MTKKVTRRELLTLLAATGSTAAVMNASAQLGLLPDTALSVPSIPNPDATNRPSVVVLGAGIAGLTAAYELDKAGYDCVVLEAAPKAGGRCRTYRSGDVIDEVGNTQVVGFDAEPHLYFNAGPARIPSTHRNVLHYCKELGVDLEVFINENKEAFYQDDAMFGGEPIKNRLLTTNVRGFMAEIIAKNLDRIELDESLDQWETEALLNAVRAFGDLSENDVFDGSFRAGYARGGFLDHGEQFETVALKELLKTGFLRNALSANEGETGPMLFQPVGGMDMLAQGFVRQLPDKIFYNIAVTGVNLAEAGVHVDYEHNGVKYQLEADYCFNCIPSHLVTGIANNFPADYTEALQYIRRGEAYKAAFQTKNRFWEKNDIYGGISWSNTPSRQFWYPPQGLFKEKGVVLAAYDFGGGMHFTKLPQEKRLEAHIRDAQKIHPEFREQSEHGITIAWHRMNHMLGCSARFARNFGGWSAEEERLYHTLQQPAGGRHYMIGDQVSQHSAWMESAVQSAHFAINHMLGQSSSVTSMPGRRLA